MTFYNRGFLACIRQDALDRLPAEGEDRAAIAACPLDHNLLVAVRNLLSKNLDVVDWRNAEMYMFRMTAEANEWAMDISNSHKQVFPFCKLAFSSVSLDIKQGNDELRTIDMPENPSNEQIAIAFCQLIVFATALRLIHTRSKNPLFNLEGDKAVCMRQYVYLVDQMEVFRVATSWLELRFNTDFIQQFMTTGRFSRHWYITGNKTGPIHEGPDEEEVREDNMVKAVVEAIQLALSKFSAEEAAEAADPQQIAPEDDRQEALHTQVVVEALNQTTVSGDGKENGSESQETAKEEGDIKRPRTDDGIA